ncbi:MAG: thiamine-phosphate kinase [Cytophagales bacterium]|nr:MAG: thiamine-phosphate kinase [Cytophagales bacterium]
MSENRTEIASLGEFGLINRLKTQFLLQQRSSIKGIDDDAAIIAPHPGEQLVVSTDMLMEGVHFDLSFHPLAHLGYKAVSVNVSDIAAMNAVPTQITVAIGLSNRFSVEAIDEIYAGIKKACEDYKIDLVGGDTTSSRAGLAICITAIGQAPAHKLVCRNTAQKGDIICVSGDLGAAYVGLQILNREKQVFKAAPLAQPKLEGHSYVLERYLRPEARTDLVHELSEKEVIPTAMIDISDGLSSELLHICKQSGLGALLVEEHIPLANQTIETATNDLNMSALTCALNGGDDYELLFTIKQSDYEKLKNHPDIHFIGYMREAEAGVKLALRTGQHVDIKAQGWTHF